MNSNEVAEYIDEQLRQGLAWPDAIESASARFGIANRDLIEQMYNDWLDEQ